MYGTNGKHVDLPEAAAGIGGTGRGFTCVSLKSLTPTQYTMAPRDLAFSACWRKTRNGSMTSEILEHPEAETAAAEEIEREAATSCCAVMSWCSCSSPSVKAMITLAGPGGNIPACQQPSTIHRVFKQTWSYQSSPVGSAHSPENSNTLRIRFFSRKFQSLFGWLGFRRLLKIKEFKSTLCNPRCINVSPPGISLFKAFSPFLMFILQRGEGCFSADENVFELFLVPVMCWSLSVFKLYYINMQYIFNLSLLGFFLGQI